MASAGFGFFAAVQKPEQTFARIDRWRDGEGRGGLEVCRVGGSDGLPTVPTYHDCSVQIGSVMPSIERARPTHRLIEQHIDGSTYSVGTSISPPFPLTDLPHVPHLAKFPSNDGVRSGHHDALRFTLGFTHGDILLLTQ